MTKKIVKSISQYYEFDVAVFNKLNLGVEIQDFTEPNLSKYEKKSIIKEYLKLFKSYNNLKCMHGPFIDLEPASPDPLIRKVSQSRYIETLKIANILGIEHVIFHSQINPFVNYPLLSDLNDFQDKEAWERILYKSKYDGYIYLENVYEQRPYMLKKRLDVINNPQIKVNLDIGHCNIGKVNLDKWLDTLKNYIGYMHVHSNSGIYDTHNPIDKLEVNKLYKKLKKYNLDPIISLEYRTNNLIEEINKFK